MSGTEKQEQKNFFLKAPIATVALILGSYLFLGILSASFILTIDLDPNDCVRVGYEGDCLEFRTEFSENAYLWNRIMQDRNLWLIGTFWILPALLYAIYIKKKFSSVGSDSESPNWFGEIFWLALFEGATLSFFGAILLSWLLPPPIEWFPSVIVEFHEYRIDRIEGAIREISK